MRQIWIPKIGKPEVLEVREAPIPEPKEGEVCIRVSAAGVNFADILARMGLYPDAPALPTVVGYEVSGVINQVGPGVENFAPGDQVLALTTFGGYSEMVVARTAQVFRLPENLPFDKAAAIPVNYLTAWLMLIHLGNVQEGDRVLVHAAAGGVGLAALQLCNWRGAQVIGTASASKHQRLKEMGMAHCIDYHTQDFEQEVKALTNGEGVDIALDAVGGESFGKSYRCLAPMGRLFVFGLSSLASGKKRSLWSVFSGMRKMSAFKPLSLIQRNRGVIGINIGHLWHQERKLKQAMDAILSLVDEGKLDPVVDKCFPFQQAAAAHDYIQSHKNFGKVLLVP